MADDKRIGKKVSAWSNRDTASGIRYDAATYIGIVKDNADPGRSGRLRVWIPDMGGDQNNELNWRTVSYASPYFGATFQPEANVNNNFTSTPNTYGMWMVPPDVGNQVLCTFVGGRPGDGYWFACVNPTVSHYMVPGLAAGNKVDFENAGDGIKKSLLSPTHIPPQNLPVSEFNDNIPGNVSEGFYNNLKPIHEFQANVLFKQGLDRDGTRGAISSSSQRETPSHVFGISTPGRAFGNDPAEDPEYDAKLASGSIDEAQYAVRTRKGGHQFVMDDGDVKGKDQVVRLRSAGGHQILMNDTEKLMYIANSEGSVWIELAESGHMHIFTAGGLNLRTRGDLNLHSDKNVNINAGQNINLSAVQQINSASAKVNLNATDEVFVWGGKTGIGAGSTMLITGQQTLVGASTSLKLVGATVDINGAKPITGLTPGNLVKNTLNDTSFDSTTGLWSEVPGVLNTVATVAPAHEPWSRTNITLGPAPTNEIPTSVCPPKSGSGVVDYTLPQPNNNKLDNGKFKGQPTPWTTDTAFLNKVKTVCGSLSVNYIDMLSCMHLETIGTFDPWIQNSLGYTGLIQFGKAAAQTIGTTTDTLRNLDRVGQCDYVLKYFQANNLNKRAPSPRLVDIYLTILWPAGVGKPEDFVIFPAGSAEYKANPAFDPGGKVGYVTVGMVAAQIATHQTTVKQALANAGVTNSGELSSGSGITVTDGSGQPVKTSAAAGSVTDTKDLGIKKAAGETVTDTCPQEILSKSTTYTPPSGIGSSAPKFLSLQVKAMMAELGYFESQLDPAKINDDKTRIGTYQVDALYLTDASRQYIKPDALKQYGATTLSRPVSWTNKDRISSQNDFMQNANLQDTIQFNEFVANYDALVAIGGILPTDDICTAAGMLFVAHQFRGVQKAKDWRDKGELKDEHGRNGTIYFNHGRYAIDILSAGGATSAPANPNVNSSGINATDVLNFAGPPTGTIDNFLSTSSAFQNAFLPMAKAYMDKTGTKITIQSAYRGQADQERIYAQWVAAGGGPNNPTAGGITTPAKPVSQGGKMNAHGDGVAIDAGSQAETVSRTVDLSQYGLRWGGTFSKPDRVHIQLANWTPSTN